MLSSSSLVLQGTFDMARPQQDMIAAEQEDKENLKRVMHLVHKTLSDRAQHPE